MDKLGHLLGFGIPTALACWLGGRGWVVLFVAHALVSEPLQQALAPTRMLDWRDTVANLVGVALGVAFAGALRRLTRHDGGMPSTREEGE